MARKLKAGGRAARDRREIESGGFGYRTPKLRLDPNGRWLETVPADIRRVQSPCECIKPKAARRAAPTGQSVVALIIARCMMFGLEATVLGGSRKGFGEEHMTAWRLANASPDLLAALKLARGVIEDVAVLNTPDGKQEYSGQGDLAYIDEAIRKAEQG